LSDALMRTSPGRWIADRWIAASTPAAPPGVAVARRGDRRPDPALVDLAGQAHTLGEWDGKLVLVNFWASWCAPCREEMPALDQFQRDFADRGVQVIGLAVDDAGSTREFLAHTPVRYPIVLAADASDPGIAFGNTRSALPFSVLIGRDGRILEQHLGGISDETLKRWVEPHL
jgi:thiol-disulfide isomerase/thioredoxin